MLFRHNNSKNYIHFDNNKILHYYYVCVLQPTLIQRLQIMTNKNYSKVCVHQYAIPSTYYDSLMPDIN